MYYNQRLQPNPSLGGHAKYHNPGVHPPFVGQSAPSPPFNQQYRGTTNRSGAPPLHPQILAGHPPSFQQDTGGWYIPATTPPVLSPPGPPLFPPGLPHPHLPHDELHPEVNKGSVSPQRVPHMDSHAYWRGRLAPLPGFTSPPGLDPTRTTKGQPIKSSAHITPTASSSLSSPKTTQAPTEDKHAFQLDKYANIFIPQYLKEIQKRHHNLEPLAPVPVFPSLKYLRTYLVPYMYKKLLETRPTSLLSAPPPMSQPAALTFETYHEHWKALLGWELDKLALDREEIILWKLGIKVSTWDDAEFFFSVPGIRENHPWLDVGDIVHLREILEDRKEGSGMAFEGRIKALRKREGLIYINCPAIKRHIQTYVIPTHSTTVQDGLRVFGPDDILPLLFNVSFMVNPRPSVLMETCCSTIGEALRVNGGSNVARKWIFPEAEDLKESVSETDGTISTSILEEDWYDAGLNDEQRLAASSIALSHSPIPFLISGPPGTGKTRTVVETVLQILRVQPDACILLCAPSNPATDTLALRLRAALSRDDMLRLNDQNRTFAEVPVSLMQYCYVEEDKFSIPLWKDLMAFRVVVCSCLDASILVGAQCTNTALVMLEEEIVSTIHPLRKPRHPVLPHWTHLLIDEAAQGSEPELLIPISVVLPPSQSPEDLQVDGETLPQLVLCGDPNQLGPIVTSEEARAGELDRSLFERLCERPVYSDNSQDQQSLPNGHLARTLPFTNLVKNYRSHPVILMPPSAIFYNDSLEPHAKNGTITWSGLPNPSLPLKFIGHDSKEECIDERATWYNTGEIDLILGVITSLLSEKDLCKPSLRAAEIGVMAPWREQVWKIRERLRNNKLSAVDVGTVEDYQGRESRVIIISCVRSSHRFLKEDSTKGVGILFERKRMNVAITRAKELLVVIGNGDLLRRDPYWKSFLQFSIRNKLYVGPSLVIESDGNYISRLESEWIRETGGLEPEEHGVITAGGIAREVLRE